MSEIEIFNIPQGRAGEAPDIDPFVIHEAGVFPCEEAAFEKFGNLVVLNEAPVGSVDRPNFLSFAVEQDRSLRHLGDFRKVKFACLPGIPPNHQQGFAAICASAIGDGRNSSSLFVLVRETPEERLPD